MKAHILFQSEEYETPYILGVFLDPNKANKKLQELKEHQKFIQDNLDKIQELQNLLETKLEFSDNPNEEELFINELSDEDKKIYQLDQYDIHNHYYLSEYDTID
jgi:ribosome assembly protein YihI (activator of Der GTPase)